MMPGRVQGQAGQEPDRTPPDAWLDIAVRQAGQDRSGDAVPQPAQRAEYRGFSLLALRRWAAQGRQGPPGQFSFSGPMDEFGMVERTGEDTDDKIAGEQTDDHADQYRRAAFDQRPAQARGASSRAPMIRADQSGVYVRGGAQLSLSGRERTAAHQHFAERLARRGDV